MNAYIFVEEMTHPEDQDHFINIFFGNTLEEALLSYEKKFPMFTGIYFLNWGKPNTYGFRVVENVTEKQIEEWEYSLIRIRVAMEALDDARVRRNSLFGGLLPREYEEEKGGES